MVWVAQQCKTLLYDTVQSMEHTSVAVVSITVQNYIDTAVLFINGLIVRFCGRNSPKRCEHLQLISTVTEYTCNVCGFGVFIPSLRQPSRLRCMPLYGDCFHKRLERGNKTDISVPVDVTYRHQLYTHTHSRLGLLAAHVCTSTSRSSSSGWLLSWQVEQ